MLKQITKDYGSVAKCPEDDERLIKMRQLLHIAKPDDDYEKRVAVNQMPVYAFYDETLPTIHTKNDFSEIYDYAIKHGCTLRMASKHFDCSLGKLNNFIRCKKPMTEKVVMVFGGEKLVDKSQRIVMSRAKKMGFHGTMSKAFKEYGLHKEIIFAPVEFNCAEV